MSKKIKGEKLGLVQTEGLMVGNYPLYNLVGLSQGGSMGDNRSKRIPYSQLTIGLDQLFFGGKLESQEQAEERADTIEAYLEANGWSWDDVLKEMSKEVTELQSKFYN
jgi:hypothetical protein